MQISFFSPNSNYFVAPFERAFLLKKIFKKISSDTTRKKLHSLKKSAVETPEMIEGENAVAHVRTCKK